MNGRYFAPITTSAADWSYLRVATVNPFGKVTGRKYFDRGLKYVWLDNIRVKKAFSMSSSERLDL